ncbi:hypothetical protein FVEN_g11086 [Fusarium venenatum]|uniref:Uncharacterized protein n=1 Tax=Fusarium venenatum TaxID=56646 RepID=A0A2L2TSX5_9HYPO|nr:uncharacterized protein FVRRES_00802 [Fusarium venenatum]KAG8350831.1 hypothetical protein FVEN_g11086 [Fusarium venenatum]KAH7005974.1 hypothetical protein EDB82DRAFT_472662 [Fusarium venenatum]CEI64290.1 unnamed protein product [Fusarium venenatum]
MKLYQVTAVLAFISTGVLATPSGYDKDNKSPEKHGDDNYPGKKGDDDYRPGKGYGNEYDEEYGPGGKRYNGKGRGDKGKKYEWDIERCDWCPYNSKSWNGYEPKGRGYKRPCPEDKKKCQKYDHDYSKATYSGYFSESQKCSKGDDYKVTGKVGACSGYGKAQCLIVQYEDWEKWSDKIAYLGLYSYKKEGLKDKKYLNFNKYCKKNKCVVPVEKVPGYPKFKDSVWVGIDDNQCREDYKKGGKVYPRGRYEEVKYLKLDIEAKYSKKCAEFCCCA